MANYEYLGDGRPDGTIIGRDTTDKLGFYGTAPVSRPAAGTLVATTAATSSSPYGFTSTQANAIIALVNEHESNFRTFGMKASS